MTTSNDPIIYTLYFDDEHKNYYERRLIPSLVEDLTVESMCWLIRNARKERGLTQERLADLLGVQKSQIAKIENGRKDVKLSTLLKVLEVMEVRVKMVVV